MTERTADGRWIVVDGRRWRASDPSIPGALRAELVGSLMDARRAVGAAKRAGDEGAEAAARQRVQHAKVALGERGEPWWEEPSADGRRERFGAAVLALADHRAPDGTTCPSDAARAVGGEAWREHMDLVRDVVRGLAADGEVEVLQKGEVIDAAEPWKGPVRIRRARA
ncbi:DUF3253 domain-containing protein [Aquihabitans sp. G128]|uniref:DUF3253 domain-containing protein n=1 Tax=Aquihabitans sp. G128 TaxID=2849779 RepID=UPI001C23A216|nr:DUF3253 domain-containing protein [Aquihabitans sp. G128]QXC60006.1 DUF3253 domain-containing protein [Aquihabitans sp. G128]